MTNWEGSQFLGRAIASTETGRAITGICPRLRRGSAAPTPIAPTATTAPSSSSPSGLSPSTTDVMSPARDLPADVRDEVAEGLSPLTGLAVAGGDGDIDEVYAPGVGADRPRHRPPPPSRTARGAVPRRWAPGRRAAGSGRLGRALGDVAGRVRTVRAVALCHGGHGVHPRLGPPSPRTRRRIATVGIRPRAGQGRRERRRRTA